MIRMRDATTLALTKLRTRKVRLIVTIVISGLLFSILAGASMVSRGVFSSISGFSKEGLGDQFFVQAAPAVYAKPYNDEDLISRAQAMHKDLVARKKAEAKRLGIEYSADADRSPVEEYDSPNGKQRTLNPMSPIGAQLINEYFAAHAGPGIPELRKAASGYGLKNVYESRHIPYDLQGARLQVLVGGQEKYDTENKQQYGPSTGIDSFVTSWTLMSNQLLKPFVLPGETLAKGADGSMPVVVPLSAAEQILQMKALPATASSSDKLARLEKLRAAAKKVAFDVCYRNATSASLIDETVNIQKEIDRNKGKKDYKRPDLVYSLPAAGCGTVGVARDVRTKEQKAMDAKQQQFDTTFGVSPASQETMRFRIVGIVPNANYGQASTVDQIISSLVTSSLGDGWFTPIEATAGQPTVANLFPATGSAMSHSAQYFAELASADQARNFIDKKSCSPDFGKMQGPEDDPYVACAAAGKQFTLNTYGSNSLGLDSAKKMFGKIFSIAGLVIAAIACLIMMGTVGKMIADSRRETAVFRAIGAKKLDIAQIYVLYTILLSVLIVAFAVVLGFAGALALNAYFSDEITIQALLAYNSQDLGRSFHLYSFYLPDMFYILGITVAAGIVSALFPLIRNLRRNPMRDMRDDT